MADLPERIREYWDRDAETYDRSPAHAVSDPVEAAVWRAVLRRHLPPPPARVLETGAGTGAITVLLAELGYRVTALDVSEAMLARARAKLLAFDVEFVVAPADAPPPGPFEAVVERNSLWTNPDPVSTLAAWRDVIEPGGRLLVMEALHARSGGSRHLAAPAARKLLGLAHEHHAPLDPEVRASLPLAGLSSPTPLIAAVRDAGWRGIRLERLRDVEWARRLAPPRVVSALESVPLCAIAADR